MFAGLLFEIFFYFINSKMVEVKVTWNRNIQVQKCTFVYSDSLNEAEDGCETGSTSQTGNKPKQG